MSVFTLRIPFKTHCTNANNYATASVGKICSTISIPEQIAVYFRELGATSGVKGSSRVRVIAVSEGTKSIGQQCTRPFL